MIFKHKILVLLVFVLGIVSLTPIVHADTQTVPLSVLKEGTQQTSYAASYFASSATVTSNSNGYTVTSTVTTNKSLGNYPVQIISIDGGAANTSKADNGSAQTITYSFETNDLQARHNAVIKVDVDSIDYHHTYHVGLQLDASAFKMPTDVADTSKISQAETVKNQSTDNVSKVNKKQAASTDKEIPELPEVETEKENKKSSEDSSSQSNGTATGATNESMEATTSISKQTNGQDVSAEKTEIKTDMTKQMMLFIGGGLAIGILMACLAIMFASRKK